MEKMDLTQMILSGATLIIIGMCGWLLTTVNSMEKEVQLISYKLNETEEEVSIMQSGLNLTDPNHNDRTCPICLHTKVGY